MSNRTFVIGVGMTKFDKPGTKEGDYWRARGHGGAPAVEGPAAVIFRVREGKALAAHVFVDEERALRSLD